jgi:hypothetical protein
MVLEKGIFKDLMDTILGMPFFIMRKKLFLLQRTQR